MATKKKVKATKLTVGLPFNLGSLEFENDEAQQRAAWSLAEPEIAKGPQSSGAIAIDVLNKGLHPLLVKWHPLLRAYEEQKPADKTTVEHELLNGDLYRSVGENRGG